MTWVMDVFNSSVFAMEYSLSCLLFMLHLRQRRHFALRYVLCLFLCLCVSNWSMAWLRSGSSIISHLNYFAVIYVIAQLILSALLTYIACTHIRFWDALFGSACAYAIQHFSYCVFYCLSIILSFSRENNGVTEFACFLVVAPLVYFLMAKHLLRNGTFGVTAYEAIQAIVIIFFFAYYLSSQAETRVAGTQGDEQLMLFIRVYAMLCCLFVLWAQASMKRAGMAQAELEANMRMEKERQSQYELSKASMDLINQKCHDLKHQIGVLRDIEEEKRNKYLKEMEESILVYDSLMHTGNEALDAILTERSLACEKEGIGWTCMADGEKLSFMDPLDLYALLGNALDNAMECARALSDPQKRLICVHIDSKPAMVVLQVENYYDGNISLSEDGLIRTSKEDNRYHGYGLRSIKDTAGKYGGTVSISLENQIFLLSVLLPLP